MTELTSKGFRNRMQRPGLCKEHCRKHSSAGIATSTCCASQVPLSLLGVIVYVGTCSSDNFTLATLQRVGASRTDQGVHAKGQCIHFDLPHEKEIGDIAEFQHSYNRMLPPDLKIYNMSIAPIPSDSLFPFHATISSTGKQYIYRFCTNDYVDPMSRLYYTHFYYPFDLDLFKHCLSQFIGTHDFSAYSNQIDRETKRLSEVYNISLRTTRTVEDIRVVEEGGGFYRVEFHLRSALYRMVRNIVGSSLFVAEGQMSLSMLQQMLHGGCNRRDNPAKSAPANGLTLQHVYYETY